MYKIIQILHFQNKVSIGKKEGKGPVYALALDETEHWTKLERSILTGTLADIQIS